MKTKKNIIDTDADPKMPYPSWTLESNIKTGNIEWKPENVELYLSEEQKTGYVRGNDLRKELEGKAVMNAVVLDWLLEHQNMIPESWKMKCVFFWGTIFRNADGNLYVECLCWNGGQWDWDYNWLAYDWDGQYPAASLAGIGTKTSEKIDSASELRLKKAKSKLERIRKILSE